MKTMLKVSFILNLVLAGCLIYLLVHHGRAAGNVASAAMTAGAQLLKPVATPAPPAVPQARLGPFCWNQLVVSNDYRVFVANLRAAGCPEPTIQDIVQGDAERAFFAKRVEMHVDGTEPGPWSVQSQLQLVASLLGEVSTSRSVKLTGTPAAYPLVLRAVDLNALRLSPEQMETIAQLQQHLQQQFLDEIGGPNQDPSNPAYLKRWRRARSNADSLLQGWLGAKIYMAYGLAAQANAQSANPGNP